MGYSEHRSSCRQRLVHVARRIRPSIDGRDLPTSRSKLSHYRADYPGDFTRSCGASAVVYKEYANRKDEDGVAEQTVTWPSRGEIEFNNFSASYSPKLDARRVINEVSFQIKSGESVAVVGYTWSGKSSIILTLLKFLHHTGTITTDGVDISNIPH